MSDDLTDAPPFERLLASCLSRVEREGPSALDEVCREHPDMADRLRAGVQLLTTSGLLDEDNGSAWVPDVLGDFRILDRIGEGGMGVVYLARQESLSREVALKLIRVDQMHLPSVRARFQREVEAVARLNHPSIVPIYGVGEQGGIPFFAMERIEGSSLDRVLRSFAGMQPEDIRAEDLATSLSLSTSELIDRVRTTSWRVFCISVARDIAAALAHAHERGVLHRDVKPSNVLVDRSARPYLVDFGLASTGGSAGLTRTGARLGSIPYMSPEQLRGEAVDARSDVYGLGACLYEMLTLTAPYGVEGGESLVGRILTEDPVPPRRRNRSLTIDDDAVCLRMLEKNPGHRYQSVAEVVFDLDNLLARRPTLARRPRWWVRSVRLAQRRPALCAAVVLGVLLVVLTPTIFAIMQHRFAVDMRSANRKLTDQFVRAEENLDNAGVAIHRLHEFASELLRGVARQDAARQEMVQLAASLYEDLLEQRPTDAGMRFEMAAIRASLGAMYLELGRSKEGEALCRAANAEFRGLMNDDRFAGRARHQVASILSKMAERVFAQGDHAQALGEMLAADAMYRASVSMEDDQLGTWVDWTAASAIHAQTLAAMGDLESAEGVAALAIERANRAHALGGSHRAAIEVRASAQSVRGMVAIYRGDFNTGAQYLQEAEETLRAILDSGSPNFNAHRTYVSIANNLGIAFLSLGRTADAITMLTRAVSKGEELRVSFPSLDNIRSEMGSAYTNLSIAHGVLGDPSTARFALEEGVRLHREVLDGSPEDVETRHSLAVALTSLSAMELEVRSQSALDLAAEANSLLAGLKGIRSEHPQYAFHAFSAIEAMINAVLREGRLDEAEELLLNSPVHESLDRDLCVVAARLWMKILDAGSASLTEDGPRERWLDCSREALERAIDLGFDGFHQLVDEPLFLPLRESDDYPGLAERAGPVD